jgi:D-amino-acid dehydrogenase
MHTVIIGAGVVGATTAWEFLRQGNKVTLIEAREGAGLETSFANGGQLSYDYVAPLADPAVFRDLPRWLLNPHSPLRFRPQPDLMQWRWLVQFMLACNARTAKASAAALLQLSYLSRDTLHRWMQDTPLEFHHRMNGKLIAYRSHTLLEKARKQVNYQAQHGSRQRVLDRNESVAVEPALANMGSDLAGCVYTPTEEAGDCYLFTKGLFEQVQAHPLATVCTGARVSSLETSGGRVVAARLHTGETIQADQFVLANGLQGAALLRQHNEYAPMYGLKGYSLTVPLGELYQTASPGGQAAEQATTNGAKATQSTSVPVAPEISVTDYEHRIVYAPLGDKLRIAAMVDIGDLNTRISPERIALLKSQVRKTFPALKLDQAQLWAGLRPATPSGKPLIGQSRTLNNLWLNLGQGALGFTLACGSAVLLHALMNNRATPIDAAPFTPR